MARKDAETQRPPADRQVSRRFRSKRLDARSEIGTLFLCGFAPCLSATADRSADRQAWLLCARKKRDLPAAGRQEARGSIKYQVSSSK